MFNLKGQNILLTGATGYLGLEMMNSLLSHGAHVYINGRNDRKVKILCKKFELKILKIVKQQIGKRGTSKHEINVITK